MTNSLAVLKKYLTDVTVEFSKIKYPDRREVLFVSGGVIITVIVCAIFFSAIDGINGLIMKFLIFY